MIIETEGVGLEKLFENEDITRRILSYLSNKDLLNFNLVNRRLYFKIKEFINVKTVEVTVDLLNDLERKNIKFKKYLRTNYNHYALDIDIRGWSRGESIPNNLYDKLFRRPKRLNLKSLTLRGRGKWDTCHCPEEKSVFGEQIGAIPIGELTNLEYIHIAQTFQISACTLLDLISKSPKLKVIKFEGILINPEHVENFETKHFSSDIECVYWPWPIRKYLPTLTTIIKRNENIKTFYSNCETTCDLLAADALPNLQFLSLILNESWSSPKKAYRYVEKVSYLATAKKLLGLEVRTFDVKELEAEEDADEKRIAELKAKSSRIERVHEQFKTKFWEQIGKLLTLKYIAIYGAWEFEEVCREMARQKLPVEYLKIALLPASIISTIDDIEDAEKKLTLSMAEGLKSIRKLVSLRSLHFACYEKLDFVDKQTTAALRELIDLIWTIDIKCPFSQEIEEFLLNLHRRSNQLGRSYKLYVHVSLDFDSEFSEFIFEPNLKSLGSEMRDKLTEMAESECLKRYDASCREFHLWGLEQTGNSRDSQAHEKMKTDWEFYQEKFNQK